MKEAFRLLTFLFGAVLVSACSKEIVFPVSEVVPSAQAVLKMDESFEEEYSLKLEVFELPEPSSLEPAQEHYVVWLVTRQHGTLNVGNLQLKEGFGKIRFTTPYEPVRLFVTAETNPQAVLPSAQKVLDSEKFKY